MRQMGPVKVEYAHERPNMVLRVNAPVRQIDVKEKRRQRVAQLSKVINAIHGEALKILAK